MFAVDGVKGEAMSRPVDAVSIAFNGAA